MKAIDMIYVTYIIFIISCCIGICLSNNQDNWYTKYQYYPSYCSTPEQMKDRRIPPIQNAHGLGETRLLHVTTILRHGTRTPTHSNMNCWDDYLNNPETGIWDCNLTSYLAPPPPYRIHQEEGSQTADPNDNAMFLFEKQYNALHDSNNNLNNELKGTCQLAQLLLQGYEQELLNGKYIRDSYVYSSTDKTDTHDSRMKLFDISTQHDITNHKYIWDSLYYRVDDDQRTLMSGQVVLRGLFGSELLSYYKSTNQYPIIPLHTADRHNDILDPNENRCPKLSELKEISQSSKDFIAFNKSSEAKTLREFTTNILKPPDITKDIDVVNCFMTTICTDRTLPESINDYVGIVDEGNITSGFNLELDEQYGPNRFERMIDFITEYDTYHELDNNGEYSKLSMGPLWSEIMDYMHPFLNNTTGDNDTDMKRSLSIFSGHDSTITPLLISLGPNVWDGIWPPYASMIIIELHAINIDGLSNKTIYQSNYAFRLIYNGKVITNRIEQCNIDMELCDMNIFLNIIKDFAIRDGNCTREHPETTAHHKVNKESLMNQTKELESSSTGIVITCVLVVCSLFIGSAFTALYITGSFRNCLKPYMPNYEYYPNEFTSSPYSDDDDDNNSNNNNIRGKNHRPAAAQYVDDPEDDMELI